MAARPPNSPSSSPRLPSPPPMAEDQTKPLSPRPGGSHDLGSAAIHSPTDASSSRRIRRGTKAADIAEGPPLVELSEIDSPFQLTEHIKALHYSYTHPANSNTISPVSARQALELSQPPQGVDRQIWLYELCRFLVMKTNIVITHLFIESPPCSAQTCPEMRASEWQYLCAVHNPPKACCAIDYCCHTLDGAANSVTSPKDFASRLALGGEGSVLAQQVKTITNIMRRVYRIYAHAWFSHREMFWKIENKEGLYVLFKTVCDAYSLIPEDNYTIPPEAEGKAPVEASREPPSISITQAAPPASILKRPEPRHAPETEDSPASQASSAGVPGATARRHRQTPSTGAAVEPVMEEAEEDDGIQPQMGPTPLNTPIKPPTTSTSPAPLPFRNAARPESQIHLNRSTSPPSTQPQAQFPAFEHTDDTSTSMHFTFPQPRDSVSAGAATSSSSATAAAATSDSSHLSNISFLDTSDSPLDPESHVPLSTRSYSAFSPPYATFSPTSPKAVTIEEMEEEREKEKEERQAEAEGESEPGPGPGPGPGIGKEAITIPHNAQLDSDNDPEATTPIEDTDSDVETESSETTIIGSEAKGETDVEGKETDKSAIAKSEAESSAVDASSSVSTKTDDEAKAERTAAEGALAGETKASEEEEAVKSVED